MASTTSTRFRKRTLTKKNMITKKMSMKLIIPGHALYEKGLQRQKGVGPLTSSQKQRVLLVPVINRG